MVFDIPFNILVAYISFAMLIGIVGIVMALRKIDGAPFITIFAGIMLFSLVVLVDNVEGTGLTGNQTQTITPITINYMNQQVSNSSTTLRNGASTFVGQEVVSGNSFLFNKEMNSIETRFGKVGNPTGNIYFGVWNGIINPTSTNYKFLVGQTLANQTGTIATSFTVTRNDTKTYIMQTNDVVGMFYNGGSLNNHIFVSYDGNLFDGSFSHLSTFTNGWIDSTSSDMRERIALVSDTLIVEDEPHNFNDTDTWAFMIVLTAFWVFLGVIFQVRNR